MKNLSKSVQNEIIEISSNMQETEKKEISVNAQMNKVILFISALTVIAYIIVINLF